MNNNDEPFNKLQTRVMNDETIGKWLFSYNESCLSEKWRLVETLYSENKLEGVTSIKVVASVIILYCRHYEDKDNRNFFGKKWAEILNYTEPTLVYRMETIYQEMDESDSIPNPLYLGNPLYICK